MTIFILQKKDYCEECRAKGERAHLVFHHKTTSEYRKMGLATYMNNNKENVVTLCRSCHAYAHGRYIKISQPTIKLITELREQKMTYQQIADYIGISRQRIYQIWKKEKEKKELQKFNLL